jgi:hypothetical protein
LAASDLQVDQHREIPVKCESSSDHEEAVLHVRPFKPFPVSSMSNESRSAREIEQLVLSRSSSRSPIPRRLFHDEIREERSSDHEEAVLRVHPFKAVKVSDGDHHSKGIFNFLI